MNDTFKYCFRKYFLSFPVGKYSDVLFLDRFINSSLKSYQTTPILASGITYLYRQHSEQDSSSFRLRSYLMMLNSITNLRRHYFIPYFIDITKKILYNSLFKSFCRSFFR